jgi:hypothetical protein
MPALLGAERARPHFSPATSRRAFAVGGDERLEPPVEHLLDLLLIDVAELAEQVSAKGPQAWGRGLRLVAEGVELGGRPTLRF